LSVFAFKHPARSYGERPDRFCIADGLLTGLPFCKREGLFPGEQWKQQVRESTLPREGFRFVEHELKNARLLSVKREEFSLDFGADSRDAFAGVGQGVLVGDVHIGSIWGEAVKSFHSDERVVVCLVKIIGKKSSPAKPVPVPVP